jgi:hypothetical protein
MPRHSLIHIQDDLGSWAQTWVRDRRTKENPKVKEETLPCRQDPATSRWFDFSPDYLKLNGARLSASKPPPHDLTFKNEKVKNNETQIYAQSPDSVSRAWSNRQCPRQQ